MWRYQIWPTTTTTSSSSSEEEEEEDGPTTASEAAADENTKARLACPPRTMTAYSITTASSGCSNDDGLRHNNISPRIIFFKRSQSTKRSTKCIFFYDQASAQVLKHHTSQAGVADRVSMTTRSRKIENRLLSLQAMKRFCERYLVERAFSGDKTKRPKTGASIFTWTTTTRLSNAWTTTGP